MFNMSICYCNCIDMRENKGKLKGSYYRYKVIKLSWVFYKYYTNYYLLLFLKVMEYVD